MAGGRLRRRARREIREKLRALAVRQLKALALRRLDRDMRLLDDAAARQEELETELTAHQEELRRLKGLIAQCGVNDALLCPLSLEIYEDPVMAADGFSYERREIENWFARGKHTSPKTNEELPHTFLTPNRDLKSTCQDFLDDVRKFDAGDV